MLGMLIISVVIVLTVLAIKDGLREEEGVVAMDSKLESALEGIELTEREERYLEWLSRMDGETIEVFAELFEKTKNSTTTK